MVGGEGGGVASQEGGGRKILLPLQGGANFFGPAIFPL